MPEVARVVCDWCLEFEWLFESRVAQRQHPMVGWGRPCTRCRWVLGLVLCRRWKIKSARGRDVDLQVCGCVNLVLENEEELG